MSRIEEMPLGLLAKVLVETVVARGGITDAGLPPALAESMASEDAEDASRRASSASWPVRSTHQRRQLESTKATRALERGTGRRQLRQERFGTWTFAQIVERAGEMLAEDPDPFDRLLVHRRGEQGTAASGECRRSVRYVDGGEKRNERGTLMPAGEAEALLSGSSTTMRWRSSAVAPRSSRSADIYRFITRTIYRSGPSCFYTGSW